NFEGIRRGAAGRDSGETVDPGRGKMGVVDGGAIEVRTFHGADPERVQGLAGSRIDGFVAAFAFPHRFAGAEYFDDQERGGRGGAFLLRTGETRFSNGPAR